MAALSGAAERNDDGICFCFDNEAYMNTGIQRCGSTPRFSWTTSTVEGKVEGKKDLPRIMAAHDVPYVATVSVAYPEDFIRKFEKARDMEPGFRYIHVHSPCPTGWRFPEEKTIEVARLAVETGVWPLKEAVHGDVRHTYIPNRLRAVTEYLQPQRRFRHLFKPVRQEEMLEQIQANVDAYWSGIDPESETAAAAAWQIGKEMM